MSETLGRVHDRTAALRLAFDRAFAEPFRLDAPATENLLAVRVGAQACALRLSGIAGLFADRKITRVPGSAAALIGLAGFRGALVPVYSLQALLGVGGARPSRWLAIAAAAPVALAFEAFEGQLRVSPDAILAAETHRALGGCAREFVRLGDFAGPILHLPSVLEIIETPGGKPAPAKEEIEEER
jgi:chemotaxis signal transduction protein